MPIVMRLDVVMATRKVRSKVLARALGITESNLSLLKSGKVRGMRFSTLEAICARLNCQPADLLEYVPDQPADALTPDIPPPDIPAPAVRKAG